jgi:hypothetical protein
MLHNRSPLVCLLTMAALAACSGGGSGSATGRNAALAFTATVLDPQLPVDPLVVSLAAGQLELAAARFHVGQI